MKKHSNKTKEAKSVSPTTIRAEAEALGTDYKRVLVPTVDVVEEGIEMMLARGDVADLQQREYQVSDDMFERVKVIVELLEPMSTVEAEVVDEKKQRIERAEAARERLMAIRERLMRIGDASKVSDDVFAVENRNYDDLMKGMKVVVDRVEQHHEQMADKAMVDALVSEARKLIETETHDRRVAKQLAKKRAANVQLAGQLKRLLFDQLRELSKVGLAAYPDDRTRDLAYQLDRFVSKRSTKAADSPEAQPASPQPEPGVSA